MAHLTRVGMFNEGFSTVVPCKACGDGPTDRVFHDLPLCAECKQHLAGGVEFPSKDRVARYIGAQQKLRRRLQP